ncbi:Tfo1 transposase [Fusarium beomiforme]|uniref:Tfo1 transposase n=1 Tax=Fusarium beomiforme TaxID=44412 RepID=A0A9P5DTH2_9HYPO|nr:Tfo1 transposase [Fusarium beomiforme]
MVNHFAAPLPETISQQEEPVLQGKRLKSTAKASQKTGIDEDHTGWQGIPALQKLHNLAVWLRSSSLHSDSWRDAVGLSLGFDNATRWSSWYKVIDNAIRNNSICRGKCSSVSQSLFLMDSLLFHYESAKAQHSQPGSMDTRMLDAIEMGWFVLGKYYTMIEDVPVYAAALLLDPSKRLAYIQQNWPRDWHEAAIACARDIWTTEYQGLVISKEPERRPAPLPSKKDGQLSFLFRSIEVKQKAIPTDSDNLDSFTNVLPLEIDCTPLERWSHIEQRAQYPTAQSDGDRYSFHPI